MSAPDADLALALPVTPSALPGARRRVRALLAPHLAPAELADILLCLQEALENALCFSRSERAIEVAVQLADHCVEVVVCDHGVGLPPQLTLCHGALACPAPLATSGRGLFLISRLMDEVEIDSAGGTTLRMRKHLA